MFTDVLIIANVTERFTVFLRGEFKCCWEIRALNAGNERKKWSHAVQTDFTDEVISETNAANERAYGKREGAREREGEIL